MFRRHVYHWCGFVLDVLLDAAAAGGGGAAGAAGAGGAAGAAGTPSSPTSPEAGAAAAAGSAAASAPAGAVPAGKTYTEAEFKSAQETARRGWVPGHTLGEKTKKVTELELQLADANKRMAALAGLAPKTETQIADEELQAAFTAKFPWFGELTPEFLKELKELVSSRKNLDDTTRNHWDNIATRTLNDLETQFLDHIDASEITPTQRQKLNAAFLAWGNGNGPDDLAKFKRRYDAEDPKLIGEFLKEFTSDFLMPARRQSAGSAVSRFRPVPSGGRSAAVVSTEPKPKPGNLDSAIDRAVKIIQERGGFDAAAR